MKVLWFTPSPGLYAPTPYGTWVEALQRAVQRYGGDMETALCFEYTRADGKTVKDGFTYYPANIRQTLTDRLKATQSPRKEYEMLKRHYKEAIADFRPDIIHCFGTELWHYSLLAQEISTPMVVHIMGFQNIYTDMAGMVTHKADIYHEKHYNPFSIFRYAFFRKRKAQIRCTMEREEMKANRYFMGRTEWDRSIVRHFSPGSRYFHCAEAIRPQIYDAARRWVLHDHKQLRLVTIGSGSTLKGNEIILKTARILTELLHADFEWRLTSTENDLRAYEQRTGISHKDVNVNLIGRVGAERIAEELADADLYIHPAIIDNSPNTLCEAQLIGTPVIAANVGGIPQLVEDGTTGILYPYNESYTLAFKIMDLYGDKARMQELSENEYRLSHARHNPEHIVRTLVGIYREIISEQTA